MFLETGIRIVKAIPYFVGLLLAGASLAAHAVTVDTISSNINGMRQLTTDNIVQRGPGVAPYYGPSVCQQQLGPTLTALQAFDPAYTCSCPKQTQPPVCSGPAHYPTATTSCTPETPFGGANDVPQDFGLNVAIPGLQPVQTCTGQGGCSTSYTNPGMTCSYPPNSNAAVSSAGVSCSAAGATSAWLAQQGYGTYQSSCANYGGCSGGYLNVCIAAIAPAGTPAPSNWSTANALPWPYEQVACEDVGLPSYAATASAETCQVFQATCAPTYVEGYQGFAYSSSMTSLSGSGLTANLPPGGYAGWSGPLMRSAGQVGGGPDYCQARFACTGQQQTSIPFEAMCEGSQGGDTGWHLGNLIIPTGAANYPSTPPGGVDYATTMVGPNWGCSGAYTGSMVPVTANVQCDGAICNIALDIASSGSCSSPNACGGATWVTAGDGWSYPNCGCGQAWSSSTGACVGHVASIRWTMIRKNYQPVCPSGLTYVPAAQDCQTVAP